MSVSGMCVQGFESACHFRSYAMYHSFARKGVSCISTAIISMLGLLLLEPKSNDDMVQVQPPLVLESKAFDFWIESQRYAPGGGFYVQGPTVLRSRKGPALMWQINSADDWGVKLQTPYLIVVKDSDSMKLLTAFDTVPVDFGAAVDTGGRIQTDAFFAHFHYRFGLGDLDEQDDQQDQELIESFSFQGAESERDYDLAAGRVFLIERSSTKQGFVINQKAWELPPYDLLNSTNGMTVDEKQINERFMQWLSKNSTSDPD